MSKISDAEAYERLHAALLALGRGDGETVRGDTTLKAAHRALTMLQIGLLASQDAETDRNQAIIDQVEFSPRQP